MSRLTAQSLSHRENRSALFAGYDSDSPYSGRSSPNPYGYQQNGHVNGSGGENQPYYGSHRSAEALEGQNDEAIEGLSAKVKMLKEITLNIGNEVRDSTDLFAKMNDAFSEASSFLGGTFKRMNRMADNHGGRWWYWLLFLIVIFFFFFFRWLWH